MTTFSATLSAPILPIYNPYYFYGSGAVDFLHEDPGYWVYFIGTSNADMFKGDDFADIMYGNGGGDDLIGMGGDDILFGGDGNDWLFGGDGDDEMYGGNDNDVFIGGQGADAHYGGNGIDTVDYSASTQAININMTVNWSFGGIESQGDTFYSIENIIGTDHDDIIVGTNGLLGNRLDGGDGEDVIFGEDGDDLIIGGAGHDDMYGGDGIDSFLFETPGPDFIGADRIHDFDTEAELLQFDFDDPEAVFVEVYETEFEGVSGLMVRVGVDQKAEPWTGFEVFLDDVTEQAFSDANLEIF